jgi:hypothetical protein
MEDVKIWTRTGQTEDLGAYIYMRHCYLSLIINILTCNNIVECWELKVKLINPSMHDHRGEIEVTSVNWEDEDAATRASRVVVSYRWHGIVYAIQFA